MSHKILKILECFSKNIPNWASQLVLYIWFIQSFQGHSENNLDTTELIKNKNWKVLNFDENKAAIIADDCSYSNTHIQTNEISSMLNQSITLSFITIINKGIIGCGWHSCTILHYRIFLYNLLFERFIINVHNMFIFRNSRLDANNKCKLNWID